MKIVVVAGGLSPERDVSLSSGCKIANALIEAGYERSESSGEVCLLDLYTGARPQRSDGRYAYSVPEHEPDLERLKKDFGNGDALIGKNVLEECRAADLVFLALHGDIGENGKLQAIFDAFGILYTGTGYIGSLLAMDKNLAKTLMRSRGILTPDWKILGANTEFEPEFPCVIKPVSCGSSVGVSIVKNKAQYIAALKYAQKYEKKIMVEEMIPGREFSVGILDGTALPAIEIMPSDGFYDYKNKYQIGLTREVCPADLPGETAEKLGNIALCVHKTLQLGSYSRIDFILSDKTGELYCLEANTLPGMTPTSLLPQEALAAGLSYVGLCDKIAKMAIENRGAHG